MRWSRPRAAAWGVASGRARRGRRCCSRDGARRRPTCSSSPSTRCAPTASAATATRGAQTPRLDAPGRARPALRAGHHRRAADAARALVALHRAPSRAWHGVRDNGGFYLGDEQVDAGRDAARARLPHRRLRRRRSCSTRRWGIAPGLRPLLRRLRPRPKFDNARGHGRHPAARAARRWTRRSRWLGEDRDAAVLRLGPPLRPARAVRGARSRFARAFPATASGAYDAEIAVTDAQVGRLLDALDADGRLRRHAGGRGAGRPRRDAGRARRADARLLHLRRRDAHPADRGRARRAARGGRRPGAHRGRDADRARAAGRPGAGGDAGREPAARSPAASGSTCSRYSESWYPALPLRLERARLRPGRPLQADPRAAAASCTTSRRTRARRATSRAEDPRRVGRRWSGRSTRCRGALASAQAPQGPAGHGRGDRGAAGGPRLRGRAA